MAEHLQNQERPLLPPLWTTNRNRAEHDPPTFRTAETPLVSPSPKAPETAPSPMHTGPHDGAMPERVWGKTKCPANDASLPSPSTFRLIQKQSPLVHKLEEASLRLTGTVPFDTDLRNMESEIASQATKVAETYRKIQPCEENGRRPIPEVFIIARSLRRHSTPHPGTPTSEVLSWEPKNTRCPTMRAVVQRRVGKPILLECRSSGSHSQVAVVVMDTAKPPSSPPASKPARKPLPVLSGSTSNTRRQSVGLPSPNTTACSLHYEKSIRDPAAVPIYSKQVIAAALPVLSLLLYCEHVKHGDLLYLPVPHAKAWPQTVHLIYTRQVELTEDIRQNILYLGGRVKVRERLQEPFQCN